MGRDGWMCARWPLVGEQDCVNTRALIVCGLLGAHLAWFLITDIGGRELLRGRGTTIGALETANKELIGII